MTPAVEPFACPRPVRALLVAAALASAAFLASTLAPALRGGGGGSALWDSWVYLGVIALASALCVARAVHSRIERWSWAALAAAMACSAVGDLWWVLRFSGLDEVPYPSIADAFYLAFYPFAYLAVLGLVRSRVPKVHAGMWLDGLVSGLAVASIVAALAFDRIVDGTSGDAATVATTLAYPVGDLLLLLVVAGVVGLSGGRPGRTWIAFGAGLVVWGASDTVYLFQAAAGTYAEGSLVDAGWPIGAVLLAAAAWRRPTRSAARAGDWTALVIPSVSTVLAAGVLVVCAAGSGRSLAIALAAGAVTSAVSRTFLTFREVRRLAETRRLALTDDLTGLPNRRSLLGSLDEVFERDEDVALLLIDLDHFKELNDTLGHHVGDRLLVLAGERMRAELRVNDVLGRLGGDEFAAILHAEGDPHAAKRVAERMRARLEAPFMLDGIPVQIDASVGVACRPLHAGTPAELLQFADVAMYQAKGARTGVEVYAAERDEHSRDRLSIVAELREGIGRGELRVHLQPQVEVATGTLVGAEALVRWEHPVRGLLAPSAFLPAVSQTNLMRPLTEHMLAEALTLAAAWRRDGRPLTISVNVAAPNLLDTDFAGVVGRQLTSTGADARDLRLEITEDGVMVDPVRSTAVLAQLKAIGVTLSIDDFGTGHSSLARLRDLPVDELKIDRTFVLGFAERPQNRAIVRAAATLGRELGLTVVAEGVEDDATWEAVRDAGADVVQGYLFARPMGADAFDAWRDAFIGSAGAVAA